MCHFLSLSIPAKSIPEVPVEFRREMRFVRHRNPSITGLAPTDWISFVAVSGECSCGFYSGDSSSGENTAKRIATYRKKGWSESKIQRALADQSNTPARPTGFRADIQRLISILVADHKQLRMSLHWYSGDIETESFPVQNLGTTTITRFLECSSVFAAESTLTLTHS